MIEPMDTFLDKLRFLMVGVLMLASVLFLPFLIRFMWVTPSVHAVGTNSTSPANPKTAATKDSPNLVTSGMFRGAEVIGQKTNSTERVVNNTFQTVTQSIVTASVTSGRFVAHGVTGSANLVTHGVTSGVSLVTHGVTGSVSLVTHVTGNGINFITHTTSNSVSFITHTTVSGAAFIAHTPGHIFGSIAHISLSSATIRPADADKTKLPVIEGDASALTQTHAAAPPQQNVKQTPPPPVDSSASWPMHGIVTTEFGVPEWPYQPIHTGIDISDGHPSGVTPIHPFKPGVVVQTIHSSLGLGNHVVVDHGGGITSVYGHLASISVSVGQKVDKTTTLGREGATGVATGPHVHFEIRVNGSPVNPHQYIGGQP